MKRKSLQILRSVTEEEQKYTYAQSMQIRGQTGNIGYLRGDFGSDGNSFYSTWFDQCESLKTDEFKAELDEVINTLRSEGCGLLKSRHAMMEFVQKNPASLYGKDNGVVSGFRMDAGKYSFLIRCNPVRGDYNFYCYCYDLKSLDRHIRNARQGIRFIDPKYNVLFHIPDGGKIVLTTSGGETEERSCRFIDEYHTEVGNQLYHICQFAELMAKNGTSYEPKEKHQACEQEKVR